jgi:hypothetical protein
MHGRKCLNAHRYDHKLSAVILIAYAFLTTQEGDPVDDPEDSLPRLVKDFHRRSPAAAALALHLHRPNRPEMHAESTFEVPDVVKRQVICNSG